MEEKHGRWSDIFVTIMPEQFWEEDFENLQKIWSIRVADFFENRVGIVIWGTDPFETNNSKYSWNFSRSFIFKRFILKSPPVIRVEFYRERQLKIMEKGFRNLSIDEFELLPRGGRYIFAKVILLGSFTLCFWVTSMKSPSHWVEAV